MPELEPSPVLLLPQVNLADSIDSTLPLEHTAVTVQVTGPVASVMVAQRFGNPLKEPAELDYLFPLPEEAAITGFELRVGARVITGDLQESQAARAAYEAAREQGKRAGLFEQRRPNLFAVQLANVQPGETIQAVMRYQQRVTFEEGVGAAADAAGGYEFVYPMGITPKYDSPAHPDEGEGVHAPIAFKGEPVGPVEIQVAIDAGLAVADPSSPSHPIEVIRLDERRVQVRLAGEQRPDRDFVLRYALAGDQLQAAGWTSKAAAEAGQEIFLATLVPPRLDTDADPLPREFIFVLDRSGSMSGDPIRQARNALRACLRALNPADMFRILLFDHDLEWFQNEPAAVTQAQVEQADHYLDRVEGRGGTEIVRALDAALSLPADPQRGRFVVFLTDGAVSGEARVLDQIRKHLGSARVFTFGIGSSVNRALLSRMASLGRGRATFLQLEEDIEGAIIRFQDSVSFPALTDITLEWEGGKAWDIYPARLPDLYYGQPLEICGQLSRGAGGIAESAAPVRVTLRGKRGTQPVSVALSLNAPSGQDAAIGRVWARARVDELLEQIQLEPQRADSLRQEIVGLALRSSLVTPYTSFVAVDREPAGLTGQPRVIHVAQPLPQGVSPDLITPQRHVLAAMAPASFLRPASPSPASDQGVMRKMKSRSIAESLVDSLADTFLGRKEKSEANDSMPPAGAAASVDRSAQEDLQPQGQASAGRLDREAALRWLARTQMLDGSWNSDVERTSAALLAFVRAGNTPRAGSFRQAMRRAVRWLVEHPGSGTDSFIRARVLEELAKATGDEADRAAAQSARLAVPAPAGPLESAALGEPITPPAAVTTLDDLRLAGLTGTRLAVPDALLRGKAAELAQIWAATIA